MIEVSDKSMLAIVAIMVLAAAVFVTREHCDRLIEQEAIKAGLVQTVDDASGNVIWVKAGGSE